MLKGIKTAAARVLRYYRSLNLSQKIMLAYLAFVMLPMGLVIPIFYNTIYNRALVDHSEARQSNLQQAADNFSRNAEQVTFAGRLIQSTDSIIEYFNGLVEGDAEMVYHIIKYIRPTLDYVRSGIPTLQNIYIYPANTQVMHFAPEVRPLGEAELALLEEVPAFSGRWTVLPAEAGAVPAMAYSQRFFSTNYSAMLGILTFETTPAYLGGLMDTLLSLSDNIRVGLYSEEGTLLYEDTRGQPPPEGDRAAALLADADAAYSIDGSYITNKVKLEGYGLWAVATHYYESELQNSLARQFLYQGILLLMMLVMMTLLYVYVNRILRDRINSLARNIQHTRITVFQPLELDMHRDEITYLTEVYNEMMTKNARLVGEMREMEKIKNKNAYAALQAQIEPHFLYNQMEALRMLAVMHGDEEISDYCYAFSQLIRYSMSLQDATVEGELENVENYLKLYKLRMTYKFSYDIFVDCTLPHLICPRLMIQPLVENAIKHGISRLRRPGQITVTVFVAGAAGQDLAVSVYDTGIGMAPEALDALNRGLEEQTNDPFGAGGSAGIGLYNVNARIKSFFGRDSGITFFSRQDQFTECILTLKNVLAADDKKEG